MVLILCMGKQRPSQARTCGRLITVSAESGFKAKHGVVKPTTPTILWSLIFTCLMSPLHRDPQTGPRGYLVRGSLQPAE